MSDPWTSDPLSIGPRQVRANLQDIQRAGVATGVHLVQRWFDATGAYGAGVYDALAKITRSPSEPAAAANALAGAGCHYAGRVALLPWTAGIVFYDELQKIRAAR